MLAAVMDVEAMLALLVTVKLPTVVEEKVLPAVKLFGKFKNASVDVPAS